MLALIINHAQLGAKRSSSVLGDSGHHIAPENLIFQHHFGNYNLIAYYIIYIKTELLLINFNLASYHLFNCNWRVRNLKRNILTLNILS